MKKLRQPGKFAGLFVVQVLVLSANWNRQGLRGSAAAALMSERE
jgi:hypothetical protein